MKSYVESKIRDIVDFPKKGIVFRDITTAVKDAKALKEIIDFLTEQFKDKKIDYVVGIESRGFIFGSALAYNLGAGLVLIRKPGKLPAETISQSYELEYGTDKIEMHKDAIEPGKNVLIIDDLLATGGTLIKAMRRLKEMGAKNIFCGISLPLFTGNAIDAFDEAYKEGCFCKIIGTNSVFHDDTLLKKEWYVSAGVSELFARFIMRLHYNESTSPLLENIKIIQKLLNP